MWSERLRNTAYKKKLYKFRPHEPAQQIETHRTKEQRATISVNSSAVECSVREMLADKIAGTLVGLWLLLPEHLRLGTWDLLSAWTGVRDSKAIEPRLALQMIHESALCVEGVRQRRTLRQKGFETLNGLPFVATDHAMHQLLEQHTIAEAESLQLGLGQIRHARGHFPGNLVLLDPHRIVTWSKRQMPLKKMTSSATAGKTLQTFFAIDGESEQPLILGIGSSSVTVTQATLSLLERLEKILPHTALLIGDVEHFSFELLHHLTTHPKFSILIPVPQYQNLLRQIATWNFTRLWAGYAIAESEYELPDHKAIRLLVQRTGETPATYAYKPFVTTSGKSAADLMTLVYPRRWNIEKFFNCQSTLGWNRASTLNLNIRFARLSMALIAQAVCYELRKKLPDEIKNWTTEQLARKLFNGMDGDIRVKNDTIIVTFYNAPNASVLKEQYENLPQKLIAEGINPKVPWLYDFKVDFRFK